MEVQWHGQEELQGLRPRWFPAVLAFAEISHWRRCRMVVGCAHRFEVLVKVIGKTITSSSRPKVHSLEVIVFPFFQSTLPLISTVSSALS